MFEIGKVASVFAAAHDACGLGMPHAYDAGPDAEVDQVTSISP